MSLYTRKKGEYVKLTRDQVRRMRRIKEVETFVRRSTHLARQVRVVVTWLDSVERQANKLEAPDLAVTRLPNRMKLTTMADDVESLAQTIRNM